MIVTQHGSWNRVPHSGYRVVFVPFAGGKPSGPPTVLLTGFLNDDNNSQGRPVGVVIDKRGAALIADDAGNIVWRVTNSQAAVVAAMPAAAPASLLTTFAEQVRVAEAAGAAVPRDEKNPSMRRCVDVNSTPNPKSGEFSVGGFSVYDAIWHQGQGKLAWKPLHPNANSPLVIRALSLDNPGTPVEYRFTTMTGSIEENMAIYPSTLRLPRAGNWLLMAESGTNWGCFLYTLR
jgi:hypothetical protein